MGSKATISLAFLLALNLIFFTVVNGCGECQKPQPNPSSHKGKCPKDTLKLKACVKLLGVVGANVGSAAKQQCCPLINDVVKLDAALCLCTAIKANVLGIINLSIPLDVSVILNNCGNHKLSGFKCPA